MTPAPPGLPSQGPPRAAVLSAAWSRDEADERHAAMRGVAGALSRGFDIDVLVAGEPGRRVADGAFDTTGIGEPPPGRRWPTTARPALDPGRAEPYRLVLVDAGDEEAVVLAAAVAPGAPVVAVGSSSDRAGGGQAWTGAGTGPEEGAETGAEGQTLLTVDLRATPADGVRPVGLSVRVHPDAAIDPHQALGGAVPYLLVLGDRPGPEPGDEPPSERARWLLARHARHHVVVVDQATAGLWRSRSLVSGFHVSSRMDLWRLIAHAWATVDLAPGPLYARECVESLRYGVPVVAPTGTPVDGLAAAGGALGFSGSAGMLACVEELEDPARRAAVAGAGKAVAERWYGDPSAFVERVAQAVGAPRAPG